MSIRRQYLTRYTLTGIMWLIAGGFNIFESNKICNVISLFAMACGAISLLCFILAKNKEDDDEMSSINAGEAYKLGFCVLVLVLLLLDLSNDFFELIKVSFAFSLYEVSYLALGAGYLALGLYFAKLDGGMFDANTED